MKATIALTAAMLMSGSPAVLAQSNLPQPAMPSQMPSATEAPAAAPMKTDTASFVRAVPSANEFEIQSSRMAQQKATSPAIKDFAAMIIADHEKAGADFKKALDSVVSTSSTTSGTVAATSLLPKEQQMLDELKALDGKAFEDRYVALQAEAHKEAVALFTAYANSGDDPALKEFAKATLPALQKHERMVKELGAM